MFVRHLVLVSHLVGNPIQSYYALTNLYRKKVGLSTFERVVQREIELFNATQVGGTVAMISTVSPYGSIGETR